MGNNNIWYVVELKTGKAQLISMAGNVTLESINASTKNFIAVRIICGPVNYNAAAQMWQSWNNGGAA